MNKVLKLNVLCEKDILFHYIDKELINEITENGTHIYFYAGNLYDAPNTFYIDSDLFNVDDFVKALNLGMKLRDEGYTSIECNYINTENK